MTKEEIIAALNELGIEYDGRLGADKLAALLPSSYNSAEPVAAPTMNTVKCRVLRDYWPTGNQEDRVRAGQIVELSVDDALDGIEIGRFERYKG